MATPTPSQPYSAGSYPTGSQTGPAPPPQSGYGSDVRQQPSAQGHYSQMPPTHQFDKYCVIHVATTCDEHGVYVTKDSAEVIEIGWVVVDAKDPNLKEVC